VLQMLCSADCLECLHATSISATTRPPKLQCVVVCCSVLQNVANVVQCWLLGMFTRHEYICRNKAAQVAVCCGVLQCVCSVSQISCNADCWECLLKCVAVCRSVLQCVALRCKCCAVLTVGNVYTPRVISAATRPWSFTPKLQCCTMCCSVWQHTAVCRSV